MLYGTHTPHQRTCGEAVSVQWWLPLLTALRGCAVAQMEGALRMWCTTVVSWSKYLLYVIPWVTWSSVPCNQLEDHMCNPLQITWPQVLATLLISSLQWQPDQGQWTPAKEPCSLTSKLKCGHSHKYHNYIELWPESQSVTLGKLPYTLVLF